MSLFSAGGGDDSLQVKLAVWGLVIAIVVTGLLPYMLHTSPTGYSLEEIYSERTNMELYTGETMINQTPWSLQHVYTPYVPGDDITNLTDEGWLYGTELLDGDGNPSFVMDGEEQIGKTTGIHLDPTKKSTVPLYQSDYTTGRTYVVTELAGNNIWEQIGSALLSVVTLGTQGWEIEKKYEGYPTWNFSGYRYEFDPMLRINTENGVDTKAVDDAKLSIVWYDLDQQEGISGGLVLYDNKTNGILASYSAAEIVASYNSMSQLASKYTLNFDGVTINMWIKFDPDVILNNQDLNQAWTDGRWTLAFSAVSADAFMDVANSSSFTGSIGNMLDTYIKIFTLSLPDVGPIWNLVLWIICVMPMSLAMIMFLSRFGIAGIGAGITAIAGGMLGGLIG